MAEDRTGWLDLEARAERAEAERDQLQDDLDLWKAHQERTKVLKKKAEAERDRLQAEVDELRTELYRLTGEGRYSG